jgi:hypothetical protein
LALKPSAPAADWHRAISDCKEELRQKLAEWAVIDNVKGV